MKVQGNIFKLSMDTFTSDHSFMAQFVSQSVNIHQTFFLFFLSSPGHFSVNDLFTVSKQLAIRFQRNFTCILMGSVRIAVQFSLTSRLTLTFQGHNYIKSHFGPYLGFCWTNCCQMLIQDSLGPGLSIDQKTSWVGWTWDVRKRVTLVALYKKTSLTITFKVRHLGWWFWHLDICFQGQGIWWCHFFWPMTLTFQGDDLWEITFWAISVINEQNVAKF